MLTTSESFNEPDQVQQEARFQANEVMIFKNVKWTLRGGDVLDNALSHLVDRAEHLIGALRYGEKQRLKT